MSGYIYCSDCFHDFGLKSLAKTLGQKTGNACPICGSLSGYHLSKKQLLDLAQSFFVDGSVFFTGFGGSECFHVGEHDPYGHDSLSDIKFTKELSHDIELFHQTGIYPFPYGPRMFRLGMTEWLENLTDTGCNPEHRRCRNKKDVIIRMVNRMRTAILKEGEIIYRVRKDPSSLNPSEYDAPPIGVQKLKGGRFNIKNNTVFYGAFSPSTCIYENNIAIKEPYTMATLKVVRPLRLKNMTKIKPDKSEYDEFTDLEYSMFLISGARNSSYKITQDIAKTVLEENYDGIIYSSFYNGFMNSKRRNNIVLFGQPIKDGKLKIVSLNQIHLQSVKYKFQYGPAFQ